MCEIKKGTCIVVGAGDFVPMEIVHTEDDLVIAADGGFAYLEMLGILPDLVLGDFDSLAPEKWEQLQELFADAPEKLLRLPCEKDDTDMRYALNIGLERGYRKFFIYGALGGRLDHTLANLQCLKYLREQGAKGYILDEKQMITVMQNEELAFHAGMEGRLSVFCMGEQAEGVTLQGLKYPLQDAVLTNSFPIGVSNEFIRDEAAKISVKKGTLLLLAEY